MSWRAWLPHAVVAFCVCLQIHFCGIEQDIRISWFVWLVLWVMFFVLAEGCAWAADAHAQVLDHMGEANRLEGVAMRGEHYPPLEWPEIAWPDDVDEDLAARAAEFEEKFASWLRRRQEEILLEALCQRDEPQ